METINDFLETDLGNISPNPRGEYDAAAYYEYLDTVSYSGGSYMCLTELGAAITGTPPEIGKNTDYWQMLALPGGLTPEYTAMHDRVVNLAEQVDGNTQEVRENTQSVADMEINIEQMQTQSASDAKAAEENKDSAAGYARAAEVSRQAAAESETNVSALVNGFDTHVSEKTDDAKDDIARARQAAVSAVVSQQDVSIKKVADDTETYIAEKEMEVQTTIKETTDAFALSVDGEIQKVTDEGEDQVKTVRETGETQVQSVTDEGTKQVEKVTDEGIKQKKNLVEKTAAGVTEIETAGKSQIDAIKEAGGGVEQALSNYFALRRNGLVFTTKIYKWETSTSPVGVKMNANENMTCTPSVGKAKGQDDYEKYGLFHHFTCNFSVDENGFNHVDALEGQTGFTKYGKVQVGEVTMSAWFGIEDAGDSVLYHYSDSQTELTPHPMKESINPDGTLSPFMIHAKYVAGDIDGVPYSSKGLAPANGCRALEARQPVSYTGMITYMHKLGGHYCGTTSWDLFYRQLMMIIKYGTTHSQSIMAGCTNYNLQYMNLVAEPDVTRVILTKAQASNFVVGSYVSIGEMGAETNKDRYYECMHNLAYIAQITKIEDVDANNAAVYVDVAESFESTLTTCISTMPWRSGSTDEVAGSDGSLGNNTSGKYAYKIQGVETCIGAYEVLGNVVMDIVTGADGNPARDVYVCEDASTLSTAIATVRASYQKAMAQVTYTAASWKYISEETTDTNLGIMIPTGVKAGSATGFADGLYTDAGTSGQREWLALGHLNVGTIAGLWILNASNGWSGGNWSIVSGVSPNGTRGEWQATA